MNNNVIIGVGIIFAVIGLLAVLSQNKSISEKIIKYFPGLEAGALLIGILAAVLVIPVEPAIQTLFKPNRLPDEVLRERDRLVGRGLVVTSGTTHPLQCSVMVSVSGFGNDDVPDLNRIGPVFAIDFNQPVAEEPSGGKEVVTSRGIAFLPWDILQFLALRGPNFDDQEAM